MGFDWRGELEKVRELVPVLEEITGRRFEIDENVQDASFFTDLTIDEELSGAQGGRLVLTVLGVRFSAFGKLFTTWSAEEASTPLPPEVTSKVIDAVHQRGYVYVEATALDADYTGANPHMRGTSWWSRFFNYL